MISYLLAWVARIISGATARWTAPLDPHRQRVYFANHASHLDFILIWSALPPLMRGRTRPVAGSDYWGRGPVRRFISSNVFNAILIERGTNSSVSHAQDSIKAIADGMGTDRSIIVFPEGTRSLTGEILPFKSGLYHLSVLKPGLELVPVYLANMNRILPKGEILPVPLIGRLIVGSPIRLEAGEDKTAFLERARATLLTLRDQWTDLAQLSMLGKLVAGVLALLIAASLVGFVLSRTTLDDRGRATVANLNARMRAWWVMVALFGVSVGTGNVGSIVLFFLLSFLAMREFMTLTPTTRADHAAIFLAFFILAPLQYLLVWMQWYGFFAVLIPVYGFVVITTRMALSGDTEHFLERTATVHWGIMACVYCVSHAPALFMLQVPGYRGTGATLLFYLVLVAQFNDAMQYVWGSFLGKTPIAPAISPNKTWGGFIGGTLTAVALGTALYWATPFTPLIAAAMSLAICLLGFAGGLVMSAIKRDRGVKDYGTLIQGHGGVLDRIDSLLFAAPVFFHLIRFFYEP